MTSERPARERVFKVVTAAYVIAPLLGELAIYQGGGKVSGAIVANVLFSVSGACVYLSYRRTGNFKGAATTSAVLQLALYSWSLLRGGGLRAEHFSYFPFFVVVNGFFLGKRAAFLTTAYSVGFTVLLAHLERAGGLPAEPHPLLTLTVQALACLSFVGWAVTTSESERRATEEALLREVAEARDQEEMLRETQSIAQVGSWHFELESRNLVWSSEQYRIFEIPEPQPQETLFELYRARVHPEDAPRLDRLVAQATETGEDYVVDFRILFDGGRRMKHIRSVTRVIQGAGGKPVAIRGTCQDMTRYVQDQSRLESQQVLIESVLNHIPDIVFVKDCGRGLKYSFFNRAAEEYLGVSASEAIGRSDHELFSKEQADRFLAKDREVIESRQITRIEQELVHSSRGDRWLKTYKVPTYKEDGSPDTLIGVATDVTEEMELQKSLELERTKAIHNAKLASLGEMAAGIAHEINNPLAIIAGNLSLIGHYREDPVKFEAKVQAMSKAAARVQKIVNGLRKFSRTSGGEERRPERIGGLISEAIVITDGKAKRHGVPIEVRVETQAYLICDGVEIEQVLVNVINNAIDAVKVLPERWVRIHAFDDGADLVVRVMDSGGPIPQEVERRLFEPFFTTKPVGEGTGLGLSISRSILDQHHATLRLDRSFATTCFELRFVRGGRGPEDQAD